jgi:hypothetical protein
MPEPRREKDESGKEILIYKSGMTKDASTGHIITPPVTSRIKSGEQGRELANVRHENVRAKARREIMRQTKAANLPDMPPIETEEDAYVAGIGLTWKKSVLNPEAYPRDVINALEMVGKLADFTQRERAPIELPKDGINIFANLSPEELLGLADGLNKLVKEDKRHEEKG